LGADALKASNDGRKTQFRYRYRKVVIAGRPEHYRNAIVPPSVSTVADV
jgi:hypothetical protein